VRQEFLFFQGLPKEFIAALVIGKVNHQEVIIGVVKELNSVPVPGCYVHPLNPLLGSNGDCVIAGVMEGSFVFRFHIEVIILIF
jgi:hypothetical protein